MPASDTSRDEITRVLDQLTQGVRQSAEELLPLLYDELRALARTRLAREAPGQTLQPTVLVHEAYLRLVGDEDPGWNGRRHFFGAAALAMRRILVEQARRKARFKHGGDLRRIDMTDADPAVEPPGTDVLALARAVERLEKSDPRKGQIVNLRFFAGLTTRETADVLELSVATVEREWRFIKTLLQVELRDAPGC
jgi:RNA polymerase sigma factor (TIGR02999 family)